MRTLPNHSTADVLISFFKWLLFFDLYVAYTLPSSCSTENEKFLKEQTHSQIMI